MPSFFCNRSYFKTAKLSNRFITQSLMSKRFKTLIFAKGSGFCHCYQFFFFSFSFSLTPNYFLYLSLDAETVGGRFSFCFTKIEIFSFPSVSFLVNLLNVVSQNFHLLFNSLFCRFSIFLNSHLFHFIV